MSLGPLNIAFMGLLEVYLVYLKIFAISIQNSLIDHQPE
jgi:hypothetical protein